MEAIGVAETETERFIGSELAICTVSESIYIAERNQPLEVVTASWAAQARAAFEDFMRLEVTQGALTSQTLRHYLYDVDQHLLWLTENGLELIDVGERELEHYCAELRSRYALSTVRRKWASLRRLYQILDTQGVIYDNPIADLSPPRNGMESLHERFNQLLGPTARRLLNTSYVESPKGFRDYAIINLILLDGLRVIEIHRLNLDDIGQGVGGTWTICALGRGNQRKTVALAGQTRDALRLWLAARRLIRPNSQAVFLNLHWTTGRSMPGRRIST